MSKPLWASQLGSQSSSNASSNILRDKSFAYDLNMNTGTVSRGVDFAPRLAEVQPGILRFVHHPPYNHPPWRGLTPTNNLNPTQLEPNTATNVPRLHRPCVRRPLPACLPALRTFSLDVEKQKSHSIRLAFSISFLPQWRGPRPSHTPVTGSPPPSFLFFVFLFFTNHTPWQFRFRGVVPIPFSSTWRGLSLHDGDLTYMTGTSTSAPRPRRLTPVKLYRGNYVRSPL